MKVKALIELLQCQDPETMVVISGYEGGYHEVSTLEHIELKLNVNTQWYYGEHEIPRGYRNEKADCKAIQIH